MQSTNYSNYSPNLHQTSQVIRKSHPKHQLSNHPKQQLSNRIYVLTRESTSIHEIYHKFQVVLDQTVCRFLGFAGIKIPKLSGTNNFTPPFSKNLQMYRAFYFSSAGSGALKICIGTHQIQTNTRCTQQFQAMLALN